MPRTGLLPLRGPLLALAALACCVVGLVSGVASVAVHEKNWLLFLLALAAPLSCALALRPGWLRCGFSAGWVALLYVALQTRPEGDYVVMSSPRGYLLVAGALVLIVLAVVTLPRPRRVAESEPEKSPT
jgi:hypothetical protein